eukprot:6462908-Amphidinium_carterae.2
MLLALVALASDAVTLRVVSVLCAGSGVQVMPKNGSLSGVYGTAPFMYACASHCFMQLASM